MGTTKKIRPLLYVDDERWLRASFERSMRRRGFEVETAASLEEAESRARERDFPVVVTDFGLEGPDGLALIEHLHQQHPDTVFILTTGQKLHMRESRIADTVTCALLAKPWDEDALHEAIERAFELHEERRGRRAGRVDQGSILLVEDNPGDADLVLAQLESMGWPTPCHVTRLEHAEETLHRQSFSILVTDLSLPDARGLDAVTRLRCAAPDAAIVVLSGVDDPDFMKQAMRLGAQDFVPKGSSESELQRALSCASERKRSETRLEHLAQRDSLTGLANRSTIRSEFSKALARRRRHGVGCAALYVDLDGFKAVNDRHGHDAGDTLLRVVADRLVAAVREYDTVARLGGDEFAVLLSDVASLEDAAATAQRLLETLAEPIQVGGGLATVGASIGLAMGSPNLDSVEELLRCADQAMYAAKRAGKNRIWCWDGCPQARTSLMPVESSVGRRRESIAS